MKVVYEDRVYVQRKDLQFIIGRCVVEYEPIPDCIMDFVLQFECNKSNENEFVEFTNQEAMKFFLSRKWCLDYNLLKDRDQLELIEYGNALYKEIEELTKLINIEKDPDNTSKMLKNRAELIFKHRSLEQIFAVMTGEQKIKIPKPRKKGLLEFLKASRK